MSFQVNSILQIGAYRFRGAHDIKIKKSIHSFTDTCNIQLPASSRLELAGMLQTESVDTAKRFVEGDAVLVHLGYNGSFKIEFKGFVRRVNFSSPCEIECEGYVYQLRKTLPAKSFVNTTLKAILQYIVQGTDIVLSPNIPDMAINNLPVKNITGAEVLEGLKKDFPGLTIFFYDNELFAGLMYTQYKGTTKLQLGWNTIKDNELKQRLASDVKLTINLTGIKSDGTKTKVTAGDNSSNVENHKTHLSTDLATLQALANKMVQDKKYDGYEGKLTCFGLPFFQHAWTAAITDKRYPERAGNYFIDSIETTYGLRGFRRIAGIGIKIS